MGQLYRHTETKLEKEVGTGFNWWVLLFGPFWYWYKGMYLRGLMWGVIGYLTLGIGLVFVAFKANKEYAEWLVEKGYKAVQGQ
ncbi:MAG: DUF2628 domain-containing protein [Chloroflexi bacterium]|nr:DUF2628 domain-containing protein [Chloroflexota bacterium]